MDQLAFLDSLTPDQSSALLTEAIWLRDKKKMELSLEEFIKGAWHVVEPGRDLIWNWHMSTVCGYLEAFAMRDIRRLIIMIPPGTMKSLIASVFYEAWIWTEIPEHRFLCGSNEDTLATRDSVRMRRLVTSDWYQERWGDMVRITADQREKTYFENTSGGFRQSQGVRAEVSGKRGDDILWDDPHDAKSVESEAKRLAVIEGWDNAWSSRLNDPSESGILIIMQRVNVNDIVGHLLKKETQDWTLLQIPMRYEGSPTYDAGKDIGRPELNDPRTKEGELLFPARFPEQTVIENEEDLGPYGTASQLQQRPRPKGGGELEKEWLGIYTNPDRPVTGNLYVIVDPAGERKSGVTGKRDNTAMGLIEAAVDQNYYLVDGYRDRLNLSERAEILFDWKRQYGDRIKRVGYEQYGMQSDIVYLKEKMERDNYRFAITELAGSLRKEDRIRRLIPIFSASRFWIPERLYKTIHIGDTTKTIDIIKHFIEEEYEPFPSPPGSQVDDFLDMLSRICDKEMKVVFPKKVRKIIIPGHQPHDPGMGY